MTYVINLDFAMLKEGYRYKGSCLRCPYTTPVLPPRTAQDVVHKHLGSAHGPGEPQALLHYRHLEERRSA